MTNHMSWKYNFLLTLLMIEKLYGVLIKDTYLSINFLAGSSSEDVQKDIEEKFQITVSSFDKCFAIAICIKM